MILGTAFKIARQRRGVTPEQIAARLDGSENEVSVRTLYLIETKEATPTLNTMKGLAEAYGVADWIDLYLELFAIMRSAGVELDGHRLSDEALAVAYTYDHLSPFRQRIIDDSVQALRKTEAMESGR